ncbi:MAG: thiol oxidoreductase [Bauldia sp.]|nr:thiol oxidoreductase [Bauldia sp.]
MKQSLILLLAAFATSGAAIAAGAAVAARADLSETDRARVAAVTTPAISFEAAEGFEAMQAGATTSTRPVSTNAFSFFSQNLSFEDQQRFVIGNGLFRKTWVSSPASTQASDGLGPLFNARSCQGCHIKDGRGHAPATVGGETLSMVVRLAVPDPADPARAIPDPTYGSQLQDSAVAGIDPEARIRITYEDVPVALNGGETVTLRRPTLTLDDPAFGPLDEHLMTSARIAPPMIGLGLLEAIHEDDILARADPEDADGDGISGRIAWLAGPSGEPLLGRFGWKASQPDIREQSGHAFAADMGLSNPVVTNPFGDCTERQAACLALPTGVQERLGAEEAPADVLDAVTFYASNLAVPVRRDVDDPMVLDGKEIFYASGCISCHAPKYVTSREAAEPALRFQLIWPYTDLLLHDMGEGLADNRPEGAATGTEWRTAPLWGIGLSTTVHPEAGFLHDGRARTLLEAVLWHGGEAQAARDAVVALAPEQRAALVAFLESL